MSYFVPFDPARRVQAVPGAGSHVEVWILGSSLFGAQLAGALGLPYAFASHFAPAHLMQAIDIYRRCFRPSAVRERPHVMVAAQVVAADTDAEARLLATSLEQAFVNLRSGRPGALPPPREGFTERLAPEHAAMLEEVFACAAIGAPDTVARDLDALAARTEADEIILTSQIFDHRARVRSMEIVAGLYPRPVAAR
jgi:luciferase family oxidoreductase group 1